jgi:hypothetical protein
MSSQVFCQLYRGSTEGEDSGHMNNDILSILSVLGDTEHLRRNSCTAYFRPSTPALSAIVSACYLNFRWPCHGSGGSCGIWRGQSDTGTVSSLSYSIFPLSISFHHSSSCTYITWGMNNGHVRGRSSEMQSHPNRQEQQQLNLNNMWYWKINEDDCILVTKFERMNEWINEYDWGEYVYLTKCSTTSHDRCKISPPSLFWLLI